MPSSSSHALVVPDGIYWSGRALTDGLQPVWALDEQRTWEHVFTILREEADGRSNLNQDLDHSGSIIVVAHLKKGSRSSRSRAMRPQSQRFLHRVKNGNRIARGVH